MTETNREDVTLRLVWPQWQGADPAVVGLLTPELGFAEAQTGYSAGSRILESLVPKAEGPEVHVPVAFEQKGLTSVDGIYARDVVISQLQAALELIDAHSPDRIVTLGGECSVSVAPFAYLAAKYADDLAVVWIDAHPDTGMPECENDGYHSMAVSHLTGHGDDEVVGSLPAVISPSRVALAGLHSWEDDQVQFTDGWGLAKFTPGDLEESSDALLSWLASTGCSKVAIHWDVDSVDSEDIVLGLGMEAGGLSRSAVVRLMNDLADSHDVVAITIAEYLPRQVIAIHQMLQGMPLLRGAR